MSDNIVNAYGLAKERYAKLGVDTDKALEELSSIPVSINCWQGDDVAGFEGLTEGVSDGGILATGSYPGRATNGDELRQDIDMALGLIPGSHKLNLHAMYAETDGSIVERDKLQLYHFSRWIEYAKNKGIGLDFNPTFFSHEKSKNGFTLASEDHEIRRFWIEHGKRSREIAAGMGEELGRVCVNNIWIPDGSKDMTLNRYKHRMILKDSLDEIFAQKIDSKYLVDAVECKLFGIGSESYVTGSHEFYLSYVMGKDISLCLDMGHFHPTESIADKISSVLTFKNDLLLHVSRPVRWDSDHVVSFNDDLQAVALEVKRAGAMNKTYFAVDFFDGSINRISAWVIGMRNTIKALLFALLEPAAIISDAERSGDLGTRLALFEESKTLPFGAVWDKYCLDKKVPVGADWIEETKAYERNVLRKRIR
jgi:L-rhamnose isomerase